MGTDAIRSVVVSTWFRLGATLLLLAIIVWRAEPQRLAGSMGRLGLANLLIALTLTVPFLGLKALRWHLMLRNAGSRTTFVEATLSLVGGMGLALVTPARLGELARIAYLPDARKLRLSALVLLDKLFDVLVLVLLAVAGAWVLLGPPVGVLFLALGVAGLAFTYRPQLVDPFVQPLARKGRFAARIEEALGALETLNPVATSSYLLLTLASFIVVILQFAIILHGPEPHLGFDAAALVFPLVILTNVVPLTIAGLGIREGASALLLGHYHVGVAVAGIAAFMMFFVNTALPGLVGALFPLFRWRRGERARDASTVSPEGPSP